MTTFSTALVILGPTGVGPFHSPDWRVGPTHIQVVEGGSNGPALMAGDHFMLINSLDPNTLLRALIVMVGTITDVSSVKNHLRETANIAMGPDGLETVTHCWDLSQEDLEWCASQLSQYVRLGVVSLDELSLLDTEARSGLTDLGFTVATFESSENKSQ